DIHKNQIGGKKLKRILPILMIVIYVASVFSQTVVSDKIIKARIDASEIIVTVDIPPGMHQTWQENMFYVDIEPMNGVSFAPVIFPPGKEENGLINYYNSIDLRIPFTLDNAVKNDSMKVQLTVGYQFCDESGVCFFPEEEILIVHLEDSQTPAQSAETMQTQLSEKAGSEEIQTAISFTEFEKELKKFYVADMAAGYIKSADFIDFVENARTADSSSAEGFAGKNIWLILLLIVLGGIALNLTPCVLPMMPITIAVLGAGTQAESKRKGFMIGGLYGIGMMLAYGTLGILVVLTGSRFGTINSSPWFNLIIAVIFIFLALAMFDVLPIDFSRFKSGKMPGKKSGKGKYITIFALGVIAAILAGACVAPVLISVILYAVTLYTAGNVAALLLPFLLGLGMALPWPFVGAGLSVLPKPGKWMKWVTKIFGIIILIIALYYGYTAFHLFSSQTDIAESQHEPAESQLEWTSSLLTGLERAAQENKPILIDFWATWCKNCLAMDATTFQDPQVQEVLQDFVLIKYQTEDLNASPHKELLDHFGIIGLPTYVVIIQEKN
ncbi:MAG: hypothetical protein APR54_02955, partial [Candidatus Cloacimonas sp. SDB]